MVSIEFGFATACIMSDDSSPMKRIYFTHTPLGYDKFKSNPALSYETFLKEIYTNPSYRNELAYFNKHCLPNDGFGFTCEEDFYYDLKNMYVKLLHLDSCGGLVIGIESLLNKNKNGHQSYRQNDDEPEL